MGAPKLYVTGMADREKVRAVLAKVRPRGATLHVTGRFPIWLFKPTEKGGVTVVRVIDQSNDSAVGEMIRTVWNEVIDQKGSDSGNDSN